MGTVRNITRRAFLIGSVAVGGAVAFGTYAVSRDPSNPLSDDLADGSATFNPWVLIDADKITLITPHADKGQGVAHSQAALIAEELDVEFGQFDVDFGKPSAAYWNTAMAEEGVPFAATDESFGAESMRGIMGGLIKVMGMQGTGGSTTIPDSFDKLRAAGASARETLKLAASQKTGIAVDQLMTKDGAVHLPDGTSLKYTELAAQAAQLDPVRDVKLRDPDQWRLIGKPMMRLDILGKSTGTLPYGIDIHVEGMKHATVCVNPRQGGSLNSYDASAALAMKGVESVLDITGGVAVVADNTWTAFQAVDAIEFEWSEASYPPEQSQHWEAVAASFNADQLDSEWRNDGDVVSAQENGDVLTVEYRSPYVAHAPLEPLNAIVKVTDEAVEIWTGHQFQRQVLVEVGKITGHAPDQITLHNQYMGGSFGHRLEFEHIKQTAEIANQMRGTPIKMTFSREEDFAHDFPRHIAIAQARGTVSDGKIESIDLDVASPSVLGSQMSRIGINVPGPDTQISAGSWNTPYALDNFRMRAYRAPELAPVSSWRSVGAPGAGFAFDSFVDELAHMAGADPLEERLRLVSHPASRIVLETVGEMSDWGTPLPDGKGRGVAFVESFGVPVAEVVEVTATDAGIKIDKVWVACDVGRIVDPVNFENLVQGGVVFGLGHAINCEITYADGKAEQSNYHAHEGMRMYQCPEIFVKGLENGSKIRGIGEPPVPPAAPALANAIFAATGQRIREMPFWNHVDFV